MSKEDTVRFHRGSTADVRITPLVFDNRIDGKWNSIYCVNCSNAVIH